MNHLFEEDISALMKMIHLTEEDESSGRKYLGFTDPLVVAHQYTYLVFPTTLAVSGILSSCPRVMEMQCWKSPIPPPLSTRLFIVLFLLYSLVFSNYFIA